MATVADIKLRGRRALHLTMGRPAMYYADGYGDPEDYVEIKARYHSNVAMAGDLAGSANQYVQNQDRKEQIIFLREQVSAPRRNALVIFSDDEGYFIENAAAPDGITITADAVKADRSDLVGKYNPQGRIIQ